jgi:hypothetical protein
MGRWSTGAITTGQCLQLNIKNFSENLKSRKEGYGGTIQWKSGARIGINLFFNDYSATLNLQYTKTDHKGEKHDLNYNVTIISHPSNLATGRIYYFLCTFSGKRCRILYMGYGSLYFKSREAYRCRIYYASQLSSRLDKHNDKYWNLEHKLEKLGGKRLKTHYRGTKTRKMQRIERLEQQQDYHEQMRWRVFPKALIKAMDLRGITDVSDLF